MANNPLLHYKAGLTMDTPVSITMAAADWAILLAWFAGLDDDETDGIKHIVYGVVSQQVAESIYSKASLQGAIAHHEDRLSHHPLVQFLQGGHPRESCGCTCPEPMGPMCNGECHPTPDGR